MRGIDPVAKLRDLIATAERIKATLVELELDPDRQTLDASALTGSTAERWAHARTAVGELWRRHGLLDATLQRADELRRSRRDAELEELLYGPSIDLAGPDVPLLERSLAGGSASGQRCTPDALVTSMSGLFEEIKGALRVIASAWEALLPGLDDARQRLLVARGLAVALGDSDGGELAAAGERVERLRARFTSDPLSVTQDEVQAAVDGLRVTVDELEAALELKRAIDVRMAEAARLLGAITDTVSSCAEAREALRVKIAGLRAPAPVAAPADLERELHAIGASAGEDSWRTARAALERWNAQAQARLREAQQALAACRAPIEARNQLRALLDAYTVKARRLGLVEEPDLASLAAQARAELYTAPTDMARASLLVRDYQLCVSRTPEVQT